MIDELLALDAGEDFESIESEVKSIDEYLYNSSNKMVFDHFNEDNSIRYFELEFEKLCAVMEEAGINSPKKLTTFEFYNRVDYLENKKVSRPQENG